jgi:hypothetical protein
MLKDYGWSFSTTKILSIYLDLSGILWNKKDKFDRIQFPGR